MCRGAGGGGGEGGRSGRGKIYYKPNTPHQPMPFSVKKTDFQCSKKNEKGGKKPSHDLPSTPVVSCWHCKPQYIWGPNWFLPSNRWASDVGCLVAGRAAVVHGRLVLFLWWGPATFAADPVTS